MKKSLGVLFFLGFFTGFSQTNNYYYNSWRLGLNLGGMWQNSDMTRNNAGFAGGFTLEKGILENKSRFFSLAIRGRALFGNTYGYSSKKNYNISSNPALNGSYNKNVNYTDTVGGPKFFVYNNYKTQISEGALELQVSFNELREKTHVILNLWGGVGFSAYRVNTNLLDADGKMYNFSKVDSTGSNSNIILSQKNFIDKSYESYGQGSKNGNLFTFSPSAGIGLGYQFGQSFSILFEYKITFPQGLNADLLDGHLGVNNHWAGKNNDFYHYAGVNFLFTLGKGKKTKSTSQTTNNTTTPVNTGVTSNPITPPTNTVGVTNTNATPIINKPAINIVNPGSSPFNSSAGVITINSKVYNVSSRNELNINYNGAGISNYTFNGNDLDFTVNLLEGNNIINISASNSGGSDSKSASIIYTKPVAVGNVVVGNTLGLTITDPIANPHTVKANNYTVKAKASGITSNSQINVTINGTGSNFSFDANTGIINFNAALVIGANNIVVTARNGKSTSSKSTTIIYEPSTSEVSVKSKVICYSKDKVNFETITIFENEWPTYQSNGAYEGPCKSKVGNGENLSVDSLIVICHRNIRGAFQTLTILKSQLASHQAHGDVRGKCSSKTGGDSGVDLDPQIIICHKEENGTLQTLTILQSQWATHQSHGDVLGKCPSKTGGDGGVELDPSLVICHKGENNSNQTITILQSQWSSHQAHGDVLGACPTNSGTANTTGGVIKICHKVAGAPDQTISIFTSAWPAHQAHGDVLGVCPAVAADPDISICHIQGNNLPAQNITIKQSAWAAHQAHGDHLGNCTNKELNPDITICHIPPGNNQNPQTITISLNAWPAHQAHGDTMGACAESKAPKGETDSETNEPKIEGEQSSPRTNKGGAIKEEGDKTEPKIETSETGRVSKPK